MAEESDITGRPVDPFVRSNTVAGGRAPIVLAGLLGDSERAGYRRLYLTTGLDYFAEFRIDQVVGVESVPPEQQPFPGLDATRVDLLAEATVDWVRRTTGGTDPFALAARDEIVLPRSVNTWEARCPGVTRRFGESDFDICDGGGRPGGGGVFGPWPTQAQTCGQNTCATCDGHTCVTCGRATCATCEGNTCVTCGQATCASCDRATCERGCVATAVTCVSCAGTCDDTCATCWNTCAGTCVSCRGTCDATCAPTCAETCGTTCGATCAATCETCHTCGFFTCGTCRTDPGWCIARG